MHEFDGWVEIDGAEDVDCDTEVLLWDGCGFSIDYVDVDVDSGVFFFANGASGITHYKLMTPPNENS